MGICRMPIMKTQKPFARSVNLPENAWPLLQIEAVKVKKSAAELGGEIIIAELRRRKLLK